MTTETKPAESTTTEPVVSASTQTASAVSVGTTTVVAAGDINAGDFITISDGTAVVAGNHIAMLDGKTGAITIGMKPDGEVASAPIDVTPPPVGASTPQEAPAATQAPADPAESAETPAVAAEDVKPAPTPYDVLTAALDDRINGNPALAGTGFSAIVTECEDASVASAALTFENEIDAAIAADNLMSVDTLEVLQLGTCVLAKTKKKKKDKDDKEDPEVVAQQLSVLHDGAAVRLLQKLYTTYVGDANYQHFMSFIGQVDKLMAEHRTHVGKTAERPVAKDDEGEGDDADMEGMEDDEEDAPSNSKDAVA